MVGLVWETAAKPIIHRTKTYMQTVPQFDGEWYVALHNGQVKGCPKYKISHAADGHTATVQEFVSSP